MFQMFGRWKGGVFEPSARDFRVDGRCMVRRVLGMVTRVFGPCPSVL